VLAGAVCFSTDKREKIRRSKTKYKFCRPRYARGAPPYNRHGNNDPLKTILYNIIYRRSGRLSYEPQRSVRSVRFENAPNKLHTRTSGT